MDTASPPPPHASPTPPPPPPAPTPPRRLTRMPKEGKVAGVAAGLGWYLGIDPVLIRIGLVVATLASGIGIPAYLIAWVILPEADGRDTRQAPPPHRDGRSIAVVGVAVLVVLLLAGQIDLFDGGVIAAAVLIGLGVLLFTDTDRSTPWTAATSWWEHRDTTQPPPAHGGPGPWAPSPPPTPQRAYPPYDAGWAHPPTPTGPPKLRSWLAAGTVGAWLLGAGVIALMDRIGVTDVTPLTAVALTLLLVGTAMVVGTVAGNGRALIGIGIPLVLVLIPLTAVSVSGVDLASGIGDRRYAPTAVEGVDEAYHLVVGAMQLDLTDLQLDGAPLPIEISMGAGELVVIVPDDVAVTVEGTVRAGEYRVFDHSASGTDLRLAERRDGEDDLGRIDLDIDVLVGDVTVQTVRRR